MNQPVSDATPLYIKIFSNILFERSFVKLLSLKEFGELQHDQVGYATDAKAMIGSNLIQKTYYQG